MKHFEITIKCAGIKDPSLDCHKVFAIKQQTFKADLDEAFAWVNFRVNGINLTDTATVMVSNMKEVK